MDKPIKTNVVDYGQPYIDEPVFTQPAKHLTTTIAESLAHAWGNVRRYQRADKRIVTERTDLPSPILLRYNHIRLRWMKPDGKGGLVQR